jgi:hypothetical protein
MKYSLLTITIISLALTAATQGAVVYVSESAADTAYSTYNSGYGGQDGSAGNPFGAISAAYHYLYNTAGDHEIRLIGDGDGVFGGGELGSNEFANGDGYLRMVSNNQFSSTDPLWNTVTLVSDTTRVTLEMSRDYITGVAEAGHNAYPAAYEKEVPNPGGSNAANRGAVIRGLWNAGTSMALTGMIVEDLNIVLGGGHVLVGTTASSTGTEQEFTFNNVNLILEREVTDADIDGDGNPATGSPWGTSSLFTHHADEATLANMYLSFNDSNIYLMNDDGTAWDSDFYVGQTWGSGTIYQLPDNFVDGNDTTTFSYWDGSEFVAWDETTSWSIYQSGRNAGNTLTAYELGVSGNNFFDLTSFNVSGGGGAIPEPASLVLMVLAGGAMMMRRRRA